jgi:succinate-semialdehyde dehydrogenase/glutarate-semialdehyde dehydrogenase
VIGSRGAEGLRVSTFTTIDPATEAEIETFETFSDRRIDALLERARGAVAAAASTTFAQRSALMHQAATYLRDHVDEFAATITREMGKAIAEARAEVAKCAVCCDYYADHAERLLADEPTPSNATESYVAYRPLGVVLAVMPWNFPFWQVFRFAAPTLMAGNVAVLKHATNVTRCALDIERVFTAVGFPAGTFTTVIVPGSEVSRLIDDPRIAAVTLTGSEAAGVSVASAAGRNLKKTVLELGGSDAFIVLADADVDAAATTAARSRFQNAGQSCIAAKRFIIEAPVYDDFIERFTAAARRLVVGDPTDERTRVGPMARGDLRDELAGLVDATVAGGATLMTGGRNGHRRGYFYDPAVVAGVRPGMPLFDEETFGPAAAVVRAADVDEAVALANDSKYGLGGNLWTRDIDRAKRLAARLESGAVFINGMTASDPRLPFGGVKRSGYGRELSSFGIREFMNIQTVWIGPDTTPAHPSAVVSE